MALPALPQLDELLTPTIRLGVTGLSRAGKTVLITAIVRALVEGGRLPFLAARAQGRLKRAYLEPQPDDHVPRFDYEAHVAALTGTPARWPDGTRQISQLRLTLEFDSRNPFRQLLAAGLGATKLHVDIVDYPGEWLIDLGLMEQNYTDWSQEALAAARKHSRAQAAAPWLATLAALDPAAPFDETEARLAAGVFATYLRTVRKAELAPTLGPGRFLLPGELDGSPMLAFVPLDLGLQPSASAAASLRPANIRPLSGTMAAMMERRFESYKAKVVEPFFREHFMKLDRQIVLVDALAAINSGPEALGELQATLTACLKAFRPGQASWLGRLFNRRIDKIVFVATKADHIHHTSHDRLEAILKVLIDEASARAKLKGAGVEVVAVAALRATRETTAKVGAEELPCITGFPEPGERIGTKLLDGKKEVAVFPGDLPSDPHLVFVADSQSAAVTFPRFQPPRLAPLSSTGEIASWPHIRLDRLLELCLGDKLT